MWLNNPQCGHKEGEKIPIFWKDYHEDKSSHMINKYMNNHSIVNLKCPCFLFRYPNLDIPSQALFSFYRARALPLRCGSEDDQNFQSPLGHSRQPVRRRQYCMVPVCHSKLQMSECLEPPLSVYSSHLVIYSSPLGIYSWCLLDAIRFIQILSPCD